MKKAGFVFGMLILGVVLFLHLLNKNYYYKTIWYNLPGIFDETLFHTRLIEKSPNLQPWPYSSRYSIKKLSNELIDSLKKFQTTSFLMIQHDSILIESYFLKTTDSTRSNSFSVAKSYVGALVGRALKLGYIKSIDQPVGDFMDEFKSEEKKNITIRHLLTMSSGLDWDESYNSLFSQTTEAYYGSNLEQQMFALKVRQKPGEYFEYKSCDTEILAMLLNRATNMPLSEFLEKELWSQMGASNASWNLDRKDGLEKAYCCIYATARDFARLGSLYLHQGNWKGQQLIDSLYIQESITSSILLNPDTEQAINFYGFQWWILTEYKGVSAYYMRGILGQNIVVIPSMDMVVVRMGYKRGEKIGKHYSVMLAIMDEAIRIKNKQK